MTARNYSNTAVATTLDGALTDSTTSVTVDDGSTYPAVPFAAQINDEVVLVVAKSGTNDVDWIVQRGYDGTTAAAHSDADDVKHVVIADDFRQRYTGGNWVLIEEIELGADAATITFNDIPQTYRHLRLIGRLRAEDQGGTGEVNAAPLRFGTGGTIDTGNNYNEGARSGGGDLANAALVEGGSYIELIMAADGGSNAGFSSHDVMIFDYTAAADRGVIGQAGGSTAAGAYSWTNPSFGQWNSTAQMDDIEIKGDSAGAGNLISGSKLALYGWRDGDQTAESYNRKWLDFESEVAVDSPTGWLKLDETSGSTAADSIDGTNDGSYSGSPSLDQGQPLPGLTTYVELNGSTQYVEWDAIADHLGATYTLETWCRTNDITNTATIFGVNTSAAGNRMVLLLSDPSDDDGEMRINGSGGAKSSGEVMMQEDGWHHIVAVHSGGTTVIYINGKAAFGKAEAATITATDTIQLGMEYDSGPTASDYWDGGFSHFIAYDKVLTPDRILAHYLAGTFGADTALSVEADVPDWISHLADRTLDEAAHSDDDEFDDGALSGDWTQVSTIASFETITEGRGLLSIRMEANGTSGDANALLKPIPGGSPTTIMVETATRHLGNMASSDKGYTMFGPVFSTGTASGSSIRYLMTYTSDGTAGRQLILNPSSGTFTAISTGTGRELSLAGVPLIYQRIRLTTATDQVEYAYSPDGVSWSDWISLGSTLASISHMGLAWSIWDDGASAADPSIVSAEYFRVTVT